MPQVMISAAHKSSGKTTVSIGLCAAMRARNIEIQPFKKGPDYIDPLWLGQAGGNACINLDFYTMHRDEISRTFEQYSSGAEFSLVEGNKGLYDGLDLDGSNSNAALASALDLPVVLVLDTQGMTRGVAPLILGYQSFAQDIKIAGVILNKVGGSRHEGKLRRVIEHYTDVPVIGSIARSPDLVLPERHLGLMPSNEVADAQQHIDRIGALVGSQVDLDRLISLGGGLRDGGKTASPVSNPDADVVIAYARDEAFGFYYADDLRKFAEAGARLVPFDTLSDVALPQADGLLIGGGFPETAMDQLEANESMRNSIRQFIENGGPAYAECGGLMYLCRDLTWEENQRKMVGVIAADVRMHNRPQGRGYGRLVATDAHPWSGATIGNDSLSAHEFHYSGLENVDADLQYAYQVRRGFGVDGEHDGIIYKNLLANYMHMRNVGDNAWITRFLDHVRRCRDED
ncbi:MAG: cobyrinate a,c-diamide synthase [bacterium]